MYCKLVLRVLGLVLIAAAALKAHGFFVPQLLGPATLAYGTWFQVGLIYGEILIGIWLILGQNLQLNWLLACLLFSLFAGINAFKAIEGEVSCGCFGIVKASPLFVSAADLVVIFLLLWVRPRGAISINFLDEFSKLLMKLGAGMGLFAALMLLLIIWV